MIGLGIFQVSKHSSLNDNGLISFETTHICYKLEVAVGRVGLLCINSRINSIRRTCERNN